MQLQEGLAEACREGGGGLGYAALGARKLCGEAGQEVVLGLLGREDGNGGQNAECVRGKEDDVLCRGSCAHGAHDVLDVVDGVRNSGVLGDGLIIKVDLAVCVDGHVLEQSVALYRIVDIGLGLLVEVYDLRVAAALEVENAVIVPAVLVVADEKALGIGGKGGLAGTGQAEEDGGVLAV